MTRYSSSEDQKVFAFPRKADGSSYIDFHVSNNKIGIEFDGQDRGSGDVDVLNFTNCLFTSPSSYYWRFASTHDSGANISFAGSTVVNSSVTLRSTVTLDSMSFIDCSSFTQNSATLTNIKFDNTKVTSASPGDADNISNSTFVSGGTGHAIEIGGTAADITLTGLTFTGYASSNGSTGNEAIFVNIATGTMTISISGGSTPSIRTAGATVTVVNSRILTLTGLVTGSDISITTAGSDTELVNVNANAGTTYEYTYPATDAGDSIDIAVYKAGYVPYFVRAYTLTSSNSSVPIAQVADRNYLV